MATKPTVGSARWATDESNNTAPSSGQRDTGWTPNQVAVSDFFNVLSLEAYRWFLYLDDGDLQGPHTFDDTVDIDGVLTTAGDVVVGDDLTVTDNLTVNGISSTFDGAVTVNDFVTCDNLIVTADADIQDDLTVAGSAALNSGVTVPTGQHYVAEGTAQYKHAVRTLRIPASAANSSSWSLQTAQDTFFWGSSASTGDRLEFPIIIDGNKRITGIEVFLVDAATELANVSLWRTTNHTTRVQVGGTAVSTGTGVDQAVSLTGLTETCASRMHTIRVERASAGSVNDITVYGAAVSYDEP